MKRTFTMAVVAALFFLLAGWGQVASAEEPPIVGRISHLDGELLRYVPEEDDWVLAVLDAPVGAQDVFYSGEGARSEFSFPNETLMRSGGATQVEVVTLGEDLTEVRVASGEVRLYNNGVDSLVKADTPYGYVVAPGGTSFDLYVGEESAEVVVLRGDLEFVHPRNGSEMRYPLRAGSFSLLVDAASVEQGNGDADPEWERWNAERDSAIQRRSKVSTPYLPQDLQSEAYVLEEQGRWERVPYEGGYRQMWRPTRVETGWSPFTCGRWTTWFGDHVWIPYEPFGHLTHHYGGWVLVNGIWYWIPPPSAVGARSVRWHPGRVLWIHTPQHIGWVPLAPHEVCYGLRYWGAGTVVVSQLDLHNIDIVLGRYANIARPVIVNKEIFYSAKGGYTPVPDSERMVIVNHARPAPIIDKTVLMSVPNERDRYRFVDATPQRMPHKSVLEQIRRQERKERVSDPRRLVQDLERIDAGKAGKEGRVKAPVLVNKMVSPSDVNKPHVVFDRKDLRSRPSGAPSKEEPPGVERPSEKAPRRPDVEVSAPVPVSPRHRSLQPGAPTQGGPRPRQELPSHWKGPRPEPEQGEGKEVEKEERSKGPPPAEKPEVQRQRPGEGERTRSQRPEPREPQTPVHPERPKLQLRPETPQRPPKEEGQQHKGKKVQPQQEEQQQRQ